MSERTIGFPDVWTLQHMQRRWSGRVAVLCSFPTLHAAICVMIGGIAVYGGDVVMWFEMKCVGAAQ